MKLLILVALFVLMISVESKSVAVVQKEAGEKEAVQKEGKKEDKVVFGDEETEIMVEMRGKIVEFLLKPQKVTQEDETMKIKTIKTNMKEILDDLNQKIKENRKKIEDRVSPKIPINYLDVEAPIN